MCYVLANEKLTDIKSPSYACYFNTCIPSESSKLTEETDTMGDPNRILVWLWKLSCFDIWILEYLEFREFTAGKQPYGTWWPVVSEIKSDFSIPPPAKCLLALDPLPAMSRQASTLLGTPSHTLRRTADITGRENPNHLLFFLLLSPFSLEEYIKFSLGGRSSTTLRILLLSLKTWFGLLYIGWFKNENYTV